MAKSRFALLSALFAFFLISISAPRSHGHTVGSYDCPPPLGKIQVVGWGSGAQGQGNQQATSPVFTEEVVQVSAGALHSVALLATGSVRAWGNNGYSQLQVPADLASVKMISAGGYHTLALLTDGTVRGWGSNEHGETAPPAGLSDVVAVSAGVFHSLALKRDGTVVAWGRASAPPSGLSDVMAISAGGYHSLALKTDGTVVAWGEPPARQNFGQSYVPFGLSQVIAVSAGQHHSLALTSDGNIHAWGYQAPLSVREDGLTVAISAGYHHNLRVKKDGSIEAWAIDFDGTMNGQAQVPLNAQEAIQISAGGFHNLALLPTDLNPASATGIRLYSSESSGAFPWYGQRVISRDGRGAAQSGRITHTQSSTFTVTVEGPGELSYDWKVSSEKDKDFLELWIDGVHYGSVSGEVDWERKTFPLSYGPHRLEFRYSKDASISHGRDSAWVDRFSFVPTGLALPGLSIRPVNHDQVELSWNAQTTEFILEYSESVSGGWKEVCGEPIFESGRASVVLPSSLSQAFFRLSR